MAKKLTKQDLENQIGELTDALQRERADADNIRKRAASEQIDNFNRGKQAAVEDLIPLIDTLERAFAYAPTDIADHKWVKGIVGLDSQLKELCAKFGLTKIETAGKEFDPETMQAVSVEEGDGKKEVVAEELQAGYLLDGRLLRAAMVKVKH